MEFSKRYLPNGKISEELSDKVNKAFIFIEDTWDFLMKKEDFVVSSFYIDKVFIVGSLLRGTDDSDVDIYFQMPNLDPEIYGFLKTASFYFLCKGKQKTRWIDTYFGRKEPGKGIFKGKEVYEISDQLEKQIGDYNSRYQ